MLKAAEIKRKEQVSHNKDNLNALPLRNLNEADNLHTTRNKNYNEAL